MTSAHQPPDWGQSLQFIEDEELRDALYRLFQRASEHAQASASDGHETLVVLVSRRLSCLYEMLVADGLEGFDGCIVVSDRALQGGIRDLAGRRVLLVDDALILGTTLVDLYDYIVERTGDALLVTPLVACVDAERYNESFAEHLGLRVGAANGPVLRSTKSLEDFAYDVARCLYRAGRPYFTDFPIVRALGASTNSIQRVLASTRWMTADVTPPGDFAGSGRRAYTLVPTADTATAIRARGLREAFELTEAMKIRLYVGSTNTPDTDWLRIVPIGLPGAVMPARLTDALEALEGELAPEGSGLDWRVWRPEAQHRLLQMYISSCVLIEFWDDLASAGFEDELEGDLLERSHLCCYFGNHDAEIIVDAFDRNVRVYREKQPGTGAAGARLPTLNPRSGLARNALVRRRAFTNGRMVAGTSELAATSKLDLLRTATSPAAPAPGTAATIDRIWAHRLLQVFGFVDAELERPQEAELKSYSLEQYRLYRASGGASALGPRVLKLGITLPELSSLLMPHADTSDPWTSALVSLAIDVGNDIGIVVPSTAFDESTHGPVYRQYRSGETAYVAGVAHEGLVGEPKEQAVANMDRYTRAALAPESSARAPEPPLDRVQQFLDETGAVVEQSLAGAGIAQAWIGEVVDVTEAHFRAVVVSQLIEGETDTARLPRKLLSSADDKALVVGALFEWVVFDTKDLRGDPRPAAQVRLTSVPIAS